MNPKERLTIRLSYHKQMGTPCYDNLTRYGDWLEGKLAYERQLNKDLLDELQLKLISIGVASQEFDSDEVHEAVSAKLLILRNWVKTKKLINETEGH